MDGGELEEEEEEEVKMLYNFPLKIPNTRRVTVTQPYRSTVLAAWYKSQGLDIPFHTGVDAICGTDVETYGTPIVCPFPNARRNLSKFDKPMGDVGNTCQIVYVAPSGQKFEMLAHHISELPPAQDYQQGDIIAYVGNTGYVNRKPSIRNPYAGAHLHLELRVDGKLVDPLTYFDPRKPFDGPDTGQEKDLPAARWVVVKLLEILRPLIGNVKLGYEETYR